MTRTSVNGGGEVAMKVGTASWMLSPAHGREILLAYKADCAQIEPTARDSALALVTLDRKFVHLKYLHTYHPPYHHQASDTLIAFQYSTLLNMAQRIFGNGQTLAMGLSLRRCDNLQG